MSTPFLAEIRIMAFGFAPRGWAQCDGQVLPINQNQALFSLLGTTYGGDGRTTFALPDLRGRAPLYQGQGIVLGQKAGAETHTLSTGEIPAHTHSVSASSAHANQKTAGGNLFATAPRAVYGSSNNLTTTGMGVGKTGGSQPHNNIQPYLVLNFCIALQGIFPSRN